MKLRAVFGYLEGESSAVLVGAADAGAWEVIGEEEWQKIVTGWKECWLGDWESYDYRETFIEVDGATPELFAAPTLKASVEEDRG